MRHPPAGAGESSRVRELYERAVRDYGNALKRLTRAYEANPDRVAHNTATSICIRRKSARVQLVSLDDLELPAAGIDRERDLDERQAMECLLGLIQRLRAQQFQEGVGDE